MATKIPPDFQPDSMSAIAKIVSEPTFDAFWDVYPRGTNKAKAKVTFDNLSKADQLNAIQGATHHATCNPQWRNPALVPHATTFLNGKRWLDDIVEEIDAKERVHASISTSNASAVWKAMTQMMGQTWINKHGEKIPAVWVTQLSKLSEAQIKKGLREFADSGKEFAPGLPEFLALCRRQADSLKPFKSLPRPYGDPKIAEAAFAELRKQGVLK
jgi:hypothetical protein